LSRRTVSRAIAQSSSSAPSPLLKKTPRADLEASGIPRAGMRVAPALVRWGELVYFLYFASGSAVVLGPRVFNWGNFPSPSHAAAGRLWSEASQKPPFLRRGRGGGGKPPEIAPPCTNRSYGHNAPKFFCLHAQVPGRCWIERDYANHRWSRQCEEPPERTQQSDALAQLVARRHGPPVQFPAC